MQWNTDLVFFDHTDLLILIPDKDTQAQVQKLLTEKPFNEYVKNGRIIRKENVYYIFDIPHLPLIDLMCFLAVARHLLPYWVIDEIKFDDFKLIPLVYSKYKNIIFDCIEATLSELRLTTKIWTTKMEDFIHEVDPHYYQGARTEK